MKELVFDEYDMKNFYVSGWYRGDKNRGMSRLKDIWFFSSSENMNKFSYLYNNIAEYNVLPKFDKEKKGISSHSLTRHHCDINGLKTKEVMRLYEGKRQKFDIGRSDYCLVRHLYFGIPIISHSGRSICKYKAITRDKKKYI